MKQDKSPIVGFRGEHRFLSNFYYCTVMMSTNPYRSVEHAYQAAKTLDSEQRWRIQECATPVEAKHLGSKVTLQPLWETIKLSTMEFLLMNKFSSRNPDLLKRLLATGDRKLIHETHWKDTYWGTCDSSASSPLAAGVGNNWLGRLLMQVRTVRQAQEERRKR